METHKLSIFIVPLGYFINQSVFKTISGTKRKPRCFIIQTDSGGIHFHFTRMSPEWNSMNNRLLYQKIFHQVKVVILLVAHPIYRPFNKNVLDKTFMCRLRLIFGSVLCLWLVAISYTFYFEYTRQYGTWVCIVYLFVSKPHGDQPKVCILITRLLKRYRVNVHIKVWIRFKKKITFPSSWTIGIPYFTYN